MGKIYASYLLKVHLHNQDDDDPTASEDAPTLEQVKETIADALVKATGDEVTISLAERTDD